MSLGSFSGGGLGFGLAFNLKDRFTNPARKIENSMDRLEMKAAAITNAINRMALGGGIAAVGLAGTIIMAKQTDLASDLQEATTKSQVVFGKYVKDVQNFVDNTARSIGMSKQEALEATGTYGNLFTALGLGQRDAAGLSVEVTKLAADMASFNNANISDTLRALRSGLSGEYEGLKKYGVVLKEDLLKREAVKMGLKNDTKGMLDPLTKIKAAYALIMKQTTNAQGDFVRTGEGYANMQRKVSAAWIDMRTSIGQVTLPIMEKLQKVAMRLLDTLAKFFNSSFGKWVLNIMFKLSGFLAILGTAILLSGAYRIAILKIIPAMIKWISWIFVSNSAMISHAAATGRLGIAFKLMGKSAIQSGIAIWTALAPLLPILIPIALGLAAIFGSIMLIRKGMKLFDQSTADSLSKLEGWRLFLAKLGGVFSGMFAIWRSATSSGFTLTEEMHDKLKSLGILDTVLALGTWIVRIKEIFRGIADVFRGVWDGVKKVMGIIKPLITQVKDKLIKVLLSLGVDVKKLNGEMGTFRKIGKVIGYLIVNLLAPAFLVIGAVVGAVVATFYAIISVVTRVIDTFKRFGSLVGGVWSKLKDFGRSVINSIWDGLKSAWQQVVDWFMGALDALFVKPMQFLGLLPDGDVNVNNTQTFDNNSASDQLTKNATAGFDKFRIPEQKAAVVNIGGVETVVYVDSDEVARKVDERQQLDNSRQ